MECASHQADSVSLHRFAFAISAIHWAVVLATAIRNFGHLSWQPWLIGARACALAASLLFLFWRPAWPNLVSRFAIVCMVLQASFACLETGFEFYEYISPFFLVAAFTFRGEKREWLRLDVPLHIACLVFPHLFNDRSEYVDASGHVLFQWTRPFVFSLLSLLVFRIRASEVSLGRKLALAEFREEAAAAKDERAPVAPVPAFVPFVCKGLQLIQEADTPEEARKLATLLLSAMPGRRARRRDARADEPGPGFPMAVEQLEKLRNEAAALGVNVRELVRYKLSD